MHTHRELIAWQRAHDLTLAVFRYAGLHWSPSIAAPLEQLRRSSLSVELNIVEGYAFGRSARCRNHFRIAFGSAAESKALIELLSELDCPDAPRLEILDSLASETRALTLRLLQKS